MAARRIIIASLIVIALALAASSVGGDRVAAQTGEVIRSFDATYVIAEDGTIAVTEDILIDFTAATQERHGILRFLLQEQPVDSDSNRLYTYSNISVDDGERRLDLSTSDSYLQLRIGDPDVLVTGEQRYRITYTLTGALNAFDDHDEFFWNVTGHEWLTSIESATVIVELPGPGVQMIACFQGPAGATEPCVSSSNASSARFVSSATLLPGSGLTIVVGIDKGLVFVAPPVLVPAHDSVSTQVKDFLGPNPATIAIVVVLLLATFAVLSWRWWLVGRDRWFGEQYYFSDAPDPERRPFFANETVVVEYEPPEVAGQDRRMRPAEAGLLLDERADTLDVSATIVDLAVRGYLRIEEKPKAGILGKADYELHDLGRGTGGLLPYERKLLDALVSGGSPALLSDLKNEFHEDLVRVKKELYKQGVNKNNFFPRNPETVRQQYGLAGAVLIVAGVAAIWFLGAVAGVGLLGIPVVVAGVLLAASSSAMPRRTARGRQMFRRILGFRTFMVAGDQDRERFAEEANIFSEYLPYAIVFGSAKKWAERFEALGIDTGEVGWFVGPRPFMAVAFATGIHDFSSSVGTVMGSTPGASGGSGFSAGGGFSGGGGGGGGGGGW